MACACPEPMKLPSSSRSVCAAKLLRPGSGLGQCAGGQILAIQPDGNDTVPALLGSVKGASGHLVLSTGVVNEAGPRCRGGSYVAALFTLPSSLPLHLVRASLTRSRSTEHVPLEAALALSNSGRACCHAIWQDGMRDHSCAQRWEASPRLAPGDELGTQNAIVPQE